MNSRMEKVAKDVALIALGSAGTVSNPPIEPEALKEAFQAIWPTQDNQRPMNDAMGAAAQAASGCSGQNAENWQTTMSRSWQAAVEEVVQEYFKAAQYSFEKGEPLQGAEILTNAVRATLGQIAATRDWPHGNHEDLFNIAAALAVAANGPTPWMSWIKPWKTLRRKGNT